MAWVKVSAEIETEEGDEVKENEEVEFEVVDGADSSLEDDAGPDGSSEADKLFTVLRGMWTQPSKKQTEKQRKSSRNRRQNNADEPLAEKKNTEENKESGRQNPARRENGKRQGITWSM